MWAGLIGLVVATVLTVVLNGRSNALKAMGKGTAATLGGVAQGSLGLAFILMEAFGERFFTNAHATPAYTMFGFLVVTVCTRARENKPNDSKAYFRLYVTIGVAMVGGGAGILVLGGSSLHRTILLEATEITLFAVFWIVQTIELCNPEAVGAVQTG